MPLKRALPAAVLATLAAAGPAWAVVGNVAVTVTDPAGRPLPGATITLTPPAGAPVTAETDGDGRALIRDVEAGSYEVILSGSEIRRTRSRVTVRGGDTTQVTFSAVRVRATPPAGCLGCLSLGPTAMLDSASDVPIIVNRSTVTFAAPGRPSQTTTEDHDLEESNRDFDHRSRLEAAGIELSLGLGGREGRFQPALVLAVGRARAELEFENLVSPGDGTLFEGSGLVLGGGLDATWFLGDGGWYASAGYRYQRLLDTDVTRSEPLTTDGGRLVLDDFTLQHQVHSAQLLVGYGGRNVAPWAGVRAVFRRTELDGAFQFDFTERFGFPVTASFVADNQFEEDVVQGIAGLDLRIPGTRLFLRGEAGFGGGGTSAGVRLVYGLGL